MRRSMLALAMLGVCCGGALAEPAAEPAAPASASPRAHAKYTLATPILELMEDPRTLAFLDRHLPGLSERMRDPEVATIFANTSLEDLSKDPDHGRGLTPEVMAKLAARLDAAQAGPAPGAGPS